jgi:methylamine dehydrogenase accessory protein MauD
MATYVLTSETMPDSLWSNTLYPKPWRHTYPDRPGAGNGVGDQKAPVSSSRMYTASPVLSLTGLQSEPVQVGGSQARATLVFFLAPTCPVCKKLIPVLKALARDEVRGMQLVLASDGDADHLGFVREHGLEQMPYVLSTELGMSYRVSRLPYAVLIDPQGVVASKGLVNSREQLDSLLNAHDMKMPTIQQYLGDPASAA